MTRPPYVRDGAGTARPRTPRPGTGLANTCTFSFPLQPSIREQPGLPAGPGPRLCAAGSGATASERTPAATTACERRHPQCPGRARSSGTAPYGPRPARSSGPAPQDSPWQARGRGAAWHRRYRR